MNDPTFDKMMGDGTTRLQLQRAYSAYRSACGAESLTPYNMHVWFISGSPLGPESATAELHVTPGQTFPASPDPASARGERRAASRRSSSPSPADFHAVCARLADARGHRYVVRTNPAHGESLIVTTDHLRHDDVVLYDCDAE